MSGPQFSEGFRGKPQRRGGVTAGGWAQPGTWGKTATARQGKSEKASFKVEGVATLGDQKGKTARNLLWGRGSKKLIRQQTSLEGGKKGGVATYLCTYLGARPQEREKSVRPKGAVQGGK